MPEGSLELLSQHEVNRLRSTGEGGQHEVLRRCALAVLNVGGQTDDTREVLEKYHDFDVFIVQQDRGVKLALKNAPPDAFVDGKMIRGIRELLFAVLRDVVFINTEVAGGGQFDLDTSDGITNAVFHILRNAGTLRAAGAGPRRVLGRARDQPRGVRLLQEGRLRDRPAQHERLHGLRRRRDEGADEGRHRRPREAADQGRPLRRRDRARHHRRGVAEPDREPAGDHAGHGEAPGGLRPHGPRDRHLSGRRRHRGGIPVPARHPAASAQPGPAVAGDPDGPGLERGLLRADRRVHRRHARAARRSSATRSSSGIPAAVASMVLDGMRRVRDFRHAKNDAYYFNWRLQLDMDFQQPVRRDAREHGGARALPRTGAGAPGGQPAQGVLRPGVGQREGRRAFARSRATGPSSSPAIATS